MSDKRRLGKGLGALIPEALAGSAEVNEVLLERIKPNPFQPRRKFDPDKLQELSESIKEYGVVQAVVVSPDGNDYILVTGERRCRAARMAGLATIPAIVRNYNQKAMLEVALVENLQREDLNPVEEAQAYRKLMADYGYTQEELAQKIGRSRSSIANVVRLLSLPERILDSLARGEMTPGQARPLLVIRDVEQQLKVAAQVIAKGLSAREVEKIASRVDEIKNKKGNHQQSDLLDPLQEELVLQMQRRLGTKVKIRREKSGGVIEILYYSDEDFERLVAKLLPEGIA